MGSQVGFWLLLLGALLFGCSAVLAVVVCRNFRKKAPSRCYIRYSVMRECLFCPELLGSIGLSTVLGCRRSFSAFGKQLLPAEPRL